jgi:hypothetical protein
MVLHNQGCAGQDKTHLSEALVMYRYVTRSRTPSLARFFKHDHPIDTIFEIIPY